MPLRHLRIWTIIIYEYICDRLNVWNNSNDDRGIQRPRTTIQTETVWKIQLRKTKKTDSPKNKTQRQPVRTWWGHKLIKNVQQPDKTAQCRYCKRRVHYEKMCRSRKKIEHFERKSSSAEEYKCDYNKIQKINSNDQKGFYNTTLLVIERPIKVIIDSGQPVTLIPNSLFKAITEVEPLITTYEDVNNQRSGYTAQT